LDIKTEQWRQVVQIVPDVKEQEFTEIFPMPILVEKYREQQLQLQQQQPVGCNVQAPVQASMAGVVQSREVQQLTQQVITILPGLTVFTVLSIVAGAILLPGN